MKMTKYAQLLIIAAFIVQPAFAQSTDYQPGKSVVKFTDINTYTSPPSSSSSTAPSSKPIGTSGTPDTSSTTSQTKTGKRSSRTYKPAPPLKPAVTSSSSKYGKSSSSKDLGRADDDSHATPVASTGTDSSGSSSGSSSSTSSSSSGSSSPAPAASEPAPQTAAVEVPAEQTPKPKKHSSSGKAPNFSKFGGVFGGLGAMGTGLAGMSHGGGFTSVMSNVGRAASGAASMAKELSTDTVISPDAPAVGYKADIPATAQGGVHNLTETTEVSGTVVARHKHVRHEETEKSEQLPEDNRPIADKWAIVMGVGKFKDPTIPSLRYAAKDAQDFADFLIKEQHFAPDHVRLLLNEKATKTEFLDEIGDKFLPRVVHRDDLVVLFFSSHGSPADRDIGGSNFVVAYDTKKDSLYSTGIEMQELTRILRERTPKANADKEGARVCILMDACHSGGGADGAKDAESTNIDAKKIDVGRGQLVISSSSANERSWESKRYKNGVFTKNLMDALRKNTGVLDAASAVEKSVSDEVQQDDATTQTITVNKTKWSGNKLILGSKPAAPLPLPASVKALLGSDSRK
jgi:uncharacterized caspase-like protein